METIKVQEWRAANGKDVALEYIMVSYTGEQFASDNDRNSLHAIGKRAAEAARVKVYWVGCSCLGGVTEVEENVWRIGDVIKGVFQVVIAVAGPVGVKEIDTLPDELLRKWGNRVWILPELLLSPEPNIDIYTLNRSLDPAQQLKQCIDQQPDHLNRKISLAFGKMLALLGNFWITMKVQ